jgi:trk system potassium uptake protein
VTDAFFESASGFTTTGATVLERRRGPPRAGPALAHFTHWLGGMGIVLLGLAVLPVLGTGGMALYRAEFSGAKSEKLKPRIAETAFALWRIYLALTFASMSSSASPA